MEELVLSMGMAENIALNEAQVKIQIEKGEIFAGFQGMVDDNDRIASIKPIILIP